MKKNLSIKWSKHLKGKEAEDFDKYIEGCTAIRERMVSILTEMIPEGVKSDYDSPSWAYKQADHNGYSRAIKDVLKLVKLS